MQSLIKVELYALILNMSMFEWLYSCVCIDKRTRDIELHDIHQKTIDAIRDDDLDYLTKNLENTSFHISFYITSIMLGHVNTLKKLYAQFNVEFTATCLEAAILTENYECLLFVSDHTTDRLSEDFMLRIVTKQHIKDQQIGAWVIDEMKGRHSNAKKEHTMLDSLLHPVSE